MSIRLTYAALIVTGLLAFAACSSGGSGTSAIPPSAQSNWRAVTIHGIRVSRGAYTFTKYPIPTASSYPNRIVTGADGALWFTEEAYEQSKIGRITTQGTFTECPLQKGIEPSHVASAFGNFWFTDANSNGLGYVTSSCQVNYYGASSTTRGIVRGALGRLWITEFEAGDIGIVDTSTGVITEYHVPTQNADPYDVTFAGGKATLWFTEFGASKIGSVSARGIFKEYPTPANPQGLAFGPDGALWFTETDANKIGRMSLTGSVTEYPLHTKNAGPVVIRAGPDALWFTEYTASKVGRITIKGRVTEIATPDSNAQPVGITIGPDKNIWFVEHATNAIVKMTL